MTDANQFVLCNLSAKVIRNLHRQPSEHRVEETLRESIAKAREYLLSGTQLEVEAKNFRHPCAKIWEGK